MHLAQILESINTPSNIFDSQSHLGIIGYLTTHLLQYAIGAAGLYFFIRLILSGYSFMTSLGDPGKLQAAQQQLVYAGFGLLIVISAFFIAQIVQFIFQLNFL